MAYGNLFICLVVDSYYHSGYNRLDLWLCMAEREVFVMARLGDYVIIKTGKLDANASSENGKYPFFTCAIEPLKIDSYSYDCECVLVAGNGDLNVKYYNGKFDAYQRTYIIESKNKTILTVPYLYCFLDKYVEELRKQSIGGVIKYIKLGNLTEAQIHMRSMNEQNEVVVNIKKVNDLISLRKQQLSKLDELVKSRFIELFGDPITNERKWNTLVWSNVLTIRNGRNQKAVENPKGQYPICGSGGIMGFADEYITEKNSVIIGRKGNINKPILMRERFWNVDTAFGLEPNEQILSVDYLFLYCLFFDFEQMNKAVTIPSLTKADLQNIVMPVPPIELQNQFSAFVEQTDKSKLAIQKSLDQLETLKKSLMQKYFG